MLYKVLHLSLCATVSIYMRKFLQIELRSYLYLVLLKVFAVSNRYI